MTRRWLNLLLVLVVLVSSAAGNDVLGNQTAKYGARIPYRLGQAVQFADFELTFRGGGSTQTGYTQREYWAFRVFSRSGAQLVLFYPDVSKPPVAARFRTAGQSFRLIADNREPGPWDGLVTVTKER